MEIAIQINAIYYCEKETAKLSQYFIYVHIRNSCETEVDAAVPEEPLEDGLGDLLGGWHTMSCHLPSSIVYNSTSCSS